MAYTNVWDDTQPTGAEAANTIDDIFRSVKVDIEQRFIDLFNMANFTADPLRAGGLKFYDTADAKFILGDNGGIPRGITLRNKGDSVTYATWNSFGISLTSGTLTGGSNPFLNVVQTWNNAATTFTGLFVNVTSSASNAASRIFDFQVASTSRLYLDRTGLVVFSNAIVSTTGLAGPVVVAGVQALFYCTAADGAVLNGNGATTDLSLQARGVVVLKVNAGTTTVIVNSGLTVAAGTTATVALNASSSFAVASTARVYLDGIAAGGDTYLVESSANIMALVCGGTTSLALSATTAAFGNLALSGITTATFTNVVTVISNDQTTSRFVLTNTGTSGRTIGLVAGNVNVDNQGFSIRNLTDGVDFIHFSNTGSWTTALGGTISSGGLTVSSGTTAVQALTSTSVSVNSGTNALTTTLATTDGNVGASTINRAAFGNSSSANAFTIDVYGGGHAKSCQVEIFNNIGASLALGTGGVASLTITATQDVFITQGKKFYLDGGTDDYIFSSAANVSDLYSAGVRAMAWSGGAVYLPNIGTTASAANLFTDNASSGQLSRSTSSKRYKTNITNYDSKKALSIIMGLKPITYTSLAIMDDPDRVFAGLIAEDVATLDPMFIHFDAEKRPDGVMYDRIGVLAVSVLQNHEERLNKLESKNLN